MNLWFRVVRVLLAALLRHRLGLLAVSTLRFRVWPSDLDLNIHMTNARYLSFMDLGRTDLIIRCGIGKLMLNHHLQAVIGGSMVRFRRPLRPFQRFAVQTRLLGWDERWFYIEQVIRSGDTIACTALVKGAFLQRGAVMAPEALVTLTGHPGPTPPIPSWVHPWKDAENAYLVDAPGVV